jgi:ABC-type oligopeptide transport system substrate-binding subunit
MKRKVLLGAAILAVGSTALVSCGGGASSSSGGTPTVSFQKDAVVTVSYPTSSNLSSQILSDDTKAIEVVFYQLNPADSNGVVGG